MIDARTAWERKDRCTWSFTIDDAAQLLERLGAAVAEQARAANALSAAINAGVPGLERQAVACAFIEACETVRAVCDELREADALVAT